MPLMIVLLTGPFSSIVAIPLTILEPILSAKRRCKAPASPVSSSKPVWHRQRLPASCTGKVWFTIGDAGPAPLNDMEEILLR